ncbi:MAG: BatA and WFA domain-containing protein [Saprospiraceae bacterium]|nr:BatA and WFA domain-containing protein [Saprospiraceae bacterium]
MHFAFPGFLWALLLLAIPIVIHLFYFRRYKKVYFTQVRLLRELVEETSARNKLRNLLVLLARLFALASLIIAFAQPQTRQEATTSAVNNLSLYIDNSWSMDALSEQGKLLQRAQSIATAIVESHSENDRFQILTNDLESRHQRIVSKDEALRFIEEIKTGPAIQPLSRIIAKQMQCFENARLDGGKLYLISDFQKSSSELDTSEIPSGIDLRLVPLQAIEENNISLDSAHFLSPVLLQGLPNKVVFYVSNRGKSDVGDLRTTLSINGLDYPGPSLNLAAGERRSDTIAVQVSQPGWQRLVIRIKDYPVQFDDQYFLACKTDANFKILALYHGEEPDMLRTAVSSIPQFEWNALQVERVQFGTFAQHKLIVLCDLDEVSSGLAQELRKATEEGVQLLIFPGPNARSESYRPLSDALGLPVISDYSEAPMQVGKLNFEAGIYDDVFSKIPTNIKLPYTRGQFRFQGGVPAERLMEYRDGSAHLLRFRLNRSLVYFSASPFDPAINELSRQAELFIPLLFKVSFNPEARQPYSHDLSKDPLVTWSLVEDAGKGDLVLSLRGPEELIPASRIQGNKLVLSFYDQIRKAGIYELYNLDALWGLIAFNDSRRESDLSCWAPEDLSSLIGDRGVVANTSGGDRNLAQQMQTEDEGQSLWWWFVLLAASFFALESLLLRILKPQ